MIKQFFHDSLIYTIPSFLSRGISIILIPLYTRVMSPANYGAFDLLMMFGSIVNLTVALEISQGVARFFSAEKNAEKKVLYFSSGFWFTLACQCIFLILGVFFARDLAKIILDDETMMIPMTLAITQIFFIGILKIIQNQFKWELRSRTFAVTSIIISLVTGISSVLLAYVYKLGLNGILIGSIIGTIAGVIYGLVKLKGSLRFSFDLNILREMIIYSWPLVFSGAAVFLNMYIDRFMIKEYLNLEQVGIYGIGMRIAGITGLIMIGSQGSLTPLILNHYAEENTPIKLAKIFRGFFALALLITLFLTLFADEVLWLMTTPQFYSASSLVIFLVPAVLLSNMYIFAPGISIVKKTGYFVLINSVGALFKYLINWFLIPIYGVSGAALSNFLGYFIVFGIYMYFSQKFYRVPHRWMSLATAGVSVMLLLFIVRILKLDRSFTSIIIKASTLFFGVGIIFITKLVCSSELKLLLTSFKMESKG